MNIQKTAPTPKLVTMIPADPQMTERDLRKKHLRVAPYCRVSTDKEEPVSYTHLDVYKRQTFYGWVFKFMGGIQIIAPQECVEEMKRIARRFL